jgi:microcystin-dependent protein
VSNYFLGQIMMTGFGFAQKNFAACNGSILAINQNMALFSLLGTRFGGNGQNTFALPDLRGRVPTGAGSSLDPGWNPAAYPLGVVAGVENVTLQSSNLPTHTHGVKVSSTLATTGAPQTGGTLGKPAGGNKLYTPAGSGGLPMVSSTIGNAGSSQPHANRQPSLAINFNIVLSGIFPSRS